MKGPMTTQTLRGMVNSGPMHWRGDRSDGFFGKGTDEELSFNNFIVAFEGLVGRESLLTTEAGKYSNGTPTAGRRAASLPNPTG